MKKIIFVLVVLLLAVPALATTVTISAVQVPDTNQVEIKYVTTGNLPRAFGLNITVNYGIITACEPAMVGECNDVLQGYGIFPGTIQIDEGGNVTDDGTPVAPSDDLGALGGIDTNGITIEMGSLYVGLNEPPASGLLCTITVTENCTVTIAGNAARCGEGSEALGVVMEDPAEVPEVQYDDGIVILDCFPTAHPDYAEWVAVGKPESWCYPRQCHGDADGEEEGTIIKKWVSYNDLTIFVTQWMTNSLDADFDHAEEGTIIKKRVSYNDLSIFVTNWMTNPAPDCLDY